MFSPTPRQLLRQGIEAARQGDRAQARMFFAKITELAPEEPLGWLWRAGVAEEPEQAMIWLNRVLDLDPRHPQASQAIGFVRMQAAHAVAQAGDPMLARQLYREAAETMPESIDPWLALAGLSQSNDEIRPYLEEILARDPNNLGCLKYLAHLDASKAVTKELASTSEIEQAPFAFTPEPDPRWDLEPVSAFDSILIEPTEGRCPKILVVDDNPAVRQFIMQHLDSYDVQVDGVDGAAGAIMHLRQVGVPDLILLDGVMPHVDGFELCKLLRQSHDTAKLPIVLLARKDGWLPRLRGMMSGFNDTLAKPISPGSLRDIVAKFVTLKSATDDSFALATGVQGS